MTQEQGSGASSQSEDRATRASPEPASGLGQKASVPCAFTPGPWRADTPVTSSRRIFMPDDTVEVRDAGLQLVACLYRENLQTGQDEANARLIAAAPELYEALATFVALLDKGEGSLSHDLEYAMRDALAKARGQ